MTANAEYTKETNDTSNSTTSTDRIDWCDTRRLIAAVAKGGWGEDGSSFYPRGWPKHPRREIGARSKLQVAPLHTLLEARWNVSSYLVLYRPPVDAEWRYRLTEEVFDRPGALDKVGGAIGVQLFAIDSDAPGHGSGGPAAVDAWFELERPKLHKLREKHGCLVYRSRNGYRILAPLLRPIELRSKEQVRYYKRLYLAWVCYLARAFEIGSETAVDELVDWQRFQRVPHDLRREGDPHEAREILGDIARIGYWDPPLVESDHAWAKEQLRERKIGFKGKTYPSRVEAPYTGATVLRTLLASRGLLGDEVEPGKWQVICPREEQHSKPNTSEADSDSVLWENGGRLGYLHCSHAGCGHSLWTYEDWIRQFDAAAIITARAAAGVGARAGAEFDPKYRVDTTDWCAIAEVVASHLPRLVWWRENIWQWNGSFYAKVKPKALSAMVRQISKRLWYVKQDSAGNETAKRFSTSTTTDAEIIAALAARPAVIMSDELEPPFFIGARPEDVRMEPHELVYYRNARVNFYTGWAYEDVDDSIFITWCLQTERSADNKTPEPREWHKFLESIWPGDAKSKAALQEWMGCALSGYVAHQKVFYFKGVRRSGKGTILRILMLIMGEGARSFRTNISGNFALEDIAHTKFAYCPDAVWSNSKDASATMESILQSSGGDALRTDQKHKERVPVCPKNWWWASNMILLIRDLSNALKGRMEYLETTVSFYGREDLGLLERLDKERAGIIRWALEGLRRLIDNKGQFTRADYYARAMEEMEQECNAPARFFAEELEGGDPSYYVTCREFREAYRASTAAANKGEFSDTKLGEALRSYCHDRHWKIDRDSKRVGGKVQNCWFGIRLRADAQTLSITTLENIHGWLREPTQWRWADGRRVREAWPTDDRSFRLSDVLTHALEIPMERQPAREDDILRHLAQLGHVPDEDGVMTFGGLRLIPGGRSNDNDEEVDFEEVDAEEILRNV